MAILQFFQVSNIASPHQELYLAKEQNSEPEQTDINAEQGKPSEEHVFRCMGALSTFCAINREVGIQYHHCHCHRHRPPYYHGLHQQQPLWSLGASTGKDDRSGPKQVFGTLCKSGWAARLTSPSPSSSKWLANILIFCHESTHLDIMIFINLHHETIRHHDNYHIHCSAPLAARLANIPMFWYEFTHLLDERVVAQDPGPRCDRSLW